jgi:hypothetical protein
VTSRLLISAVEQASLLSRQDLGKFDRVRFVSENIDFVAFSYAYPSGGLNGSVVSPRPTYSEVPINMGQVVGAGKSSLAAIVVALAFAHLA